MKYRAIQLTNGKFEVEYKWFCFWEMSGGQSFNTAEEAISFAQRHSTKSPKKRRLKVIWK